ncbi:MAG: LysR family transcriptional regulator [Myxococcales bacterium]|nr:LysR family transcriptional regulator [Myxococcales bacterium]
MIGSPLPDPESLRCFLGLAERLNFRAAAATVGLSPAAFGSRIKGLEEALGATLFARTTRSVRLTASGEALVPQARRCIEEARRCAEVAKLGELPSFELTVGTRYELGMSWLLPAIDELAALTPQRALHLYFGDTPDLLPRMQRGQLDCVVTSARIADASFDYARLHEERYVLVASPRTLAGHALRRPEDAARHTLIDAHADLPLFRYFLDARPSEELWRFARVDFFGTIAAIRARVLAHAGVAVLPHYFVKADLTCGRLRTVAPRTKLPSDWFRLVWRQGHPRTSQLHVLASQLSKQPLR